MMHENQVSWPALVRAIQVTQHAAQGISPRFPLTISAGFNWVARSRGGVKRKNHNFTPSDQKTGSGVYQAENPLIALFRFARPALIAAIETHWTLKPQSRDVGFNRN
jgi:hypothetical protein